MFKTPRRKKKIQKKRSNCKKGKRRQIKIRKK
jgi:hypothetical protein